MLQVSLVPQPLWNRFGEAKASQCRAMPFLGVPLDPWSCTVHLPSSQVTRGIPQPQRSGAGEGKLAPSFNWSHWSWGYMCT